MHFSKSGLTLNFRSIFQLQSSSSARSWLTTDADRGSGEGVSFMKRARWGSTFEGNNQRNLIIGVLTDIINREPIEKSKVVAK